MSVRRVLFIPVNESGVPQGVSDLTDHVSKVEGLWQPPRPTMACPLCGAKPGVPCDCESDEG